MHTFVGGRQPMLLYCKYCAGDVMCTVMLILVAYYPYMHSFMCYLLCKPEYLMNMYYGIPAVTPVNCFVYVHTNASIVVVCIACTFCPMVVSYSLCPPVLPVAAMWQVASLFYKLGLN